MILALKLYLNRKNLDAEEQPRGTDDTDAAGGTKPVEVGRVIQEGERPLLVEAVAVGRLQLQPHGAEQRGVVGVGGEGGGWG